MHVCLLCVGKPREQSLELLHDRFAERVRRLGARYEVAFVPEVRAGGRFTAEHATEREAATLLAALPRRGTAIALHGAGRMFSSEEVAQRIERWTVPHATFLVGGPHGLHRTVLERADVIWSLSRLTFPHELARTMVAEQIYRALAILRGLPYHK